MKDYLIHDDFIGSVHFQAEDEIFFGKIEGIDDLITFEGKSVAELKKAFKEAVEDYLDTCNRHGKDIEKSYKGSFNVRISTEMHKKAKRIAIMKGISLNQFIQKAIEDEIYKEEKNSTIGIA
jgi:predicted HicB family RNase H-like nuclease